MFKPGQQVQCVTTDGHEDMVVGRVYTIRAVEQSDLDTMLSFEECKKFSSWFAHRFKPVDQETQPPVSKTFRPGQKVMCVEGFVGTRYTVYKGSIYTVKRVERGHQLYLEETNNVWFNIDRFRPINHDRKRVLLCISTSDK